jgi:hypothetical protein
MDEGTQALGGPFDGGKVASEITHWRLLGKSALGAILWSHAWVDVAWRATSFYNAREWSKDTPLSPTAKQRVRKTEVHANINCDLT